VSARVRVRLQVDTWRGRARHERTAHFLHPGKTAGTAVKYALQNAPAPTRYRVRMHTHGVRMSDLPRGDKFFFVVRDPVDRFVSGFSSRQRQGRPRHNTPWTPAEQRAFERFSSPQALAEALGGNGDDLVAAVDAMRSIQHVAQSYWYWFGDPASFRRRWDDVLFVGFQESLDAQLPVLAERLGVERLEVPADDVRANRSTTSAPPPLTKDARDVLADWYVRDYEFVELCHELIAES
jgi:Sulfotransferase family